MTSAGLCTTRPASLYGSAVALNETTCSPLGGLGRRALWMNPDGQCLVVGGLKGDGVGDVSGGGADRGCSPATITNAVHAGAITSRHAGRSYPALDRSTVEEFAREFGPRLERRQRVAAAERRRRAENREPPDTEHLWLNPTEVGEVPGITESRVRQLANRDRIPHTRRGIRI